MRRISLALVLSGCSPPPTPEVAVREQAPAAAAPVVHTAAPAPAPTFAWVAYPLAPCLGAAAASPKRSLPAGPAISCEDATRQRDAWRTALATTAAPARLPQALPEASHKLASPLTVGSDSARTTLVTRGPAGLLRVDLTAAGAVERVVHGAVEPLPAPDATALRLAVLLPAGLAPPEYRVYDRVGPDGEVQTRVLGNVSMQGDVARGLAPVAVDQPAIDAWLRAELPAVRGPVLTLTADRSAIYDPTRATWRVWTAAAEPADPDDPGEALALGGAGVAFVAPPTNHACISRWFGPADDVGQVVCKIVALPGGGARFTRVVPGGLELADVDERGVVRSRLTLPRTTALAVSPVASPAQQLAWTQGGRLTVEDAAGRRVLARGAPTCRAGAPSYCAVTYARILGADSLLVEETRGPEHMHAHVVGLAGPALADSPCDLVAIDHREATSEALLECEGDWTLRTWDVASGGETDRRPDPAHIAGRRLRGAPAGVLEIAGERVCAVDGWLHQGPACVGLQRYNAKDRAYEPAP